MLFSAALTWWWGLALVAWFSNREAMACLLRGDSFTAPSAVSRRSRESKLPPTFTRPLATVAAAADAARLCVMSWDQPSM